MRSTVRRLLVSCGVASALLVGSPVAAHELADASATLVVRDGGHVQLRLQVPWAELLHTAWMPKRSMQEFLVVATNQPRADFARQLDGVTKSIERSTRLVADAGAPVLFNNWTGATAADVQEALKRELMSRLAEGDRFEHASRLPMTAEIALGHEISSVRVQLPNTLGAALVTVYRPEERWVKPGELSAPVSVGRRSPTISAPGR